MSAPTVEPGVTVTVDVDLDLEVPCDWVLDGKCPEPAEWQGTMACDPHHRGAYCGEHRRRLDADPRLRRTLRCTAHGLRRALPIRWAPL